MTFSIGVVGVGQFGGQFAHLFNLHPGVSEVFVVDERPERAAEAVERFDLAGAKAASRISWPPTSTPSPSSRSGGPTAPWWSRRSVPASTSTPLCRWPFPRRRSRGSSRPSGKPGIVYMMGETSYYNPATVYARKQHAAGKFGRIFYTEGDYVHDMDLGFYDAYQYSGGDRWKETASYPPMLYPTHAIGGVLGALPPPMPSASAAWASRTTARTACSTRTSACSATTSPTPRRSLN